MHAARGTRCAAAARRHVLLDADDLAQTARQAEASAAPRKRGPKPDPVLAEARQVEQLQREKRSAATAPSEAHTVIEVQKKLCTLLGLPTADEPDETN